MGLARGTLCWGYCFKDRVQGRQEFGFAEFVDVGFRSSEVLVCRAMIVDLLDVRVSGTFWGSSWSL